jgi:hypothetical protein
MTSLFTCNIVAFLQKEMWKDNLLSIQLMHPIVVAKQYDVTAPKETQKNQVLNLSTKHSRIANTTFLNNGHWLVQN